MAPSPQDERSGLSRRRFLAATAIAGAQAAALGNLGLASAFAQDDAPAASSDVDPNFIAGQIVASGAGGELAVRDLDSNVRTVHASAASGIWKQAVWNQESLEVGDCLYARGQLDVGNVLVIDRAWANISNIAAEVVRPGRSELQLKVGPDAAAQTVGLSDRSSFVAASGTPLKGGASALASGMPVQVVVFRNPDGSYTASRVILLASTADATDEEQKVELAPSLFQERGVTSWFCCGNVSGCGRCAGFSYPGACASVNCRSDRLHLAWPKLCTGCTAGNGCGDIDEGNIDRLHCDSTVKMDSPCADNTVDVQIRDCGPALRCVSPLGCKDRKKVKFDLTPCAFSRLHNDLSDGITAANATYRTADMC